MRTNTKSRLALASLTLLAALVLVVSAILLLGLGVGIVSADPGTVYVATTGEDNGSCGTEISPCLTIQYAIDHRASAGDTVNMATGTYTESVNINKGLTILLADGTVIKPSFPCFTVNANDTTIKSDTFLGGVCEPSGGSDGIVTGQAVNNLVIRGIEIRNGIGTGDGIHIGHNVTNLQIFDTYIHNMGGDGIEYASDVTVGGVHEVQGNLFQSNTGYGVNNVNGPSYYDVEYNSWNHYDGPTPGGDGVNGSLDYTPWTHVVVSSTTSSGSPVPNKVGEGYQITYTVKMDAKEVWGTDFDLNFDHTKLEVKSVITNTTFQQNDKCKVSTPAEATATGVISFCGYSTTVVNGPAQEVFKVVFEGLNAGTVDLNLDETDDAFSMAPPGGGSNNIYASALTDGGVTVYATTTITGRIDLQGRADDAGAVMTFEPGSGPDGPHYGPFTFSTSVYWGSVSASNVVYTDTYDITVDMDLYLNVTITSTKSVTITTDNQELATLHLLGGDADDSDNIDISDTVIICGQYGNSGSGITDSRADINADDVIDTSDLALMCSNYGKESATAYATSWTP